MFQGLHSFLGTDSCNLDSAEFAHAILLRDLDTCVQHLLAYPPPIKHIISLTPLSYLCISSARDDRCCRSANFPSPCGCGDYPRVFHDNLPVFRKPYGILLQVTQGKTI